MRKLLLISMLSLFMSGLTTPAFAKCDGGETVTGVLNGHAYCKSQSMMTWWAAFAWCKYQNRELATLSEACPDWYGANVCPNLMVDKKQWVWTANPSGSSYAFSVNLSSGNIGHLNTRATNYGGYALCY